MSSCDWLVGEVGRMAGVYGGDLGSSHVTVNLSNSAFSILHCYNNDDPTGCYLRGLWRSVQERQWIHCKSVRCHGVVVGRFGRIPRPHDIDLSAYAQSLIIRSTQPSLVDIPSNCTLHPLSHSGALGEN
jgi:hypothetical protein